MIVRMHPRSTTIDLCNVTVNEANALLNALRHEIIRSQRRIEDQRVGEESIRLEKDNKRLLNVMRHTLEDFVAPTANQKDS